MLHLAVGLLPLLLPFSLAWAWRRRDGSWEAAVGKALLTWGGAVWLFSETASAFGRLDLGTALQFWIPAHLATLAWIRAMPPRPATAAADGNGPLRGALWLGLGLTAAFLALLGLRSPVLNFDAMLYHLPRVEQWAQNRSLAHFPTPYDLQVFYKPWAELAILQSRLLQGGTKLAFAVQWLALLGSCAGVAGLARVLGGGAWAGLLAALSLLALPMANLQSVTAQNDLVTAQWLIWAAFFTLRFHRKGLGSDALWAAAALGLGLATKGSFYVFGLPWGLGLAWAWLRRQRLRRAWLAGVMALLIAAPSTGAWLRNHHASGSWLGSSSEHLVARIDPAGLASNLLKSLSYDALATDRRWNALVHLAVEELHAGLGWKLNDPSLIWAGLPYGCYFHLSGAWKDDYAGSPWHLLALGILTLAVSLGWRRNGPLPWVLAAAWLGYAVFSALTRFNPWCTRLHLPVFALLCGPLGLALEGLLAVRGRAMAGAVLLAYGAWIATHNVNQPWTLAFRPEAVAEAYTLSEAWSSGVPAGLRAAGLGSRVGILQAERELELPLWVGLRAGGVQRIQHLNHTPSTARAAQSPRFAGFKPDVIVRDNTRDTPDRLDWGGRRWRRVLKTELWSVYAPAGMP